MTESRLIFCRKCEKNLDVGCFYAAYIKSDTVRGTCKKCSVEQSRRWNLENKDRHRETLKRSQEKHRKLQAEIGYLTTNDLKCRSCGEIKPVDQFYKRYVYAKSKVGKCKPCSIRDRYQWTLAHKEHAAHWRANSPKLKACRSRWGKENRPKLTAAYAKWREGNRALVNEHGARNRAKSDGHLGGRGSRAVAWADRAAIRAMYAEAQRLSKETGIKHHVDHVIPLRGENVCGLHAETNLQILPAYENQKKRNSFCDAGHGQ